MTSIITKPIKRFFAIGCSFTTYDWTTWAEIVAQDLNVDEYYNLGKCGGGNEFMFNRLMQIDELYNLNRHDLVMICWTNICREDRYIGEWLTSGNIYTQYIYPDEFVKKYYQYPEHVALHDFAYIKASRMLLEYKKVQWHFLQMMSLFDFANQWVHHPMHITEFNVLVEPERPFLKKSFYDVLWDNDLQKNKLEKEKKIFKKIDGHPSPGEHLKYLQAIFPDHKWKESTLDLVNQRNNEHYNNFKNLKSNENVWDLKFTPLKKSLEPKLIF